MHASRLINFLLLQLGLVFCCAGTRQEQNSSSALNPLLQLRQEIDQVLQDSSLAQSQAGILVVSLEADEILYARDHKLLFHPASNMKLLTTATALSKLGPNFKFRTVVYSDTSALSDSTIDGNIYLKGFGNPDLVTDDLHSIVRRLHSRGVRRITGDLICDDTYLDDLHWGSGWMWDDVSAWYWAAIGALTVNDNCVTVTVLPGEYVGDSLRVHMEPPTSYMSIQNLGLTVDSLDTNRIREFKVERHWRPPSNSVVVEGGRTVSSGEKNYVIDVVEPALYAGRLFVESLQQSGINFSGEILRGVVSDSNVVLAEHLSLPLTSVVINTNKVSDNLSAELLLKTLGAEFRGPPGTAKKGLSVIKAFFTEFGIDTTAFGLADGSGVSRYNVVSPNQMVELLKAMHQDFRVQAEFKASLPIAGVDGTLSKRMRLTAAEGKLRAKTGSLRGVSSLSGYTSTADGELLAFAMMMEHFVVPTSRIRNIQDKIGALLSGFRRSVPTDVTSTYRQ